MIMPRYGIFKEPLTQEQLAVRTATILYGWMGDGPGRHLNEDRNWAVHTAVSRVKRDIMLNAEAKSVPRYDVDKLRERINELNGWYTIEQTVEQIKQILAEEDE